MQNEEKTKFFRKKFAFFNIFFVTLQPICAYYVLIRGYEGHNGAREA